MECPNDISSMIDVAKVADLVLLMVDANFGFEMEIFEFLNIAQVWINIQYIAYIGIRYISSLYCGIIEL